MAWLVSTIRLVGLVWLVSTIVIDGIYMRGMVLSFDAGSAL